MLKPDWKTAPSWAQYLAQDPNGGWWWFEVAPCPTSLGWVVSQLGTGCERATIPGEWRKSLTVRGCEAVPLAPLPLLVRDIARDLGISALEACRALKPLGNFSVNSAVTAEMAAKLREYFPDRVPDPEVVGRMTSGRACYFMERFLKEEKLLGPNEQAALHYIIDMLEADTACNQQKDPQ